jgi:SAM-dependent methyltransferase
MNTPEFDKYSSDYAQLLKDPVRDLFSADGAFFHTRKRDLVGEYFRRNDIDPTNLRYLDLGCGKGELLRMLGPAFGRSCGCDPSAEMMSGLADFETRVQTHFLQIPFADAEFDFVTAVCVYHHVAPHDRAALTREVWRVLRPGGTFCIIEHNPFNPATQLIVKRTPVDVGAILLRAAETRRLMTQAGFAPHGTEYFLYLTEGLYPRLGWLERRLKSFPLGGQYAVFGTRPARQGEMSRI